MPAAVIWRIVMPCVWKAFAGSGENVPKFTGHGNRCAQCSECRRWAARFFNKLSFGSALRRFPLRQAAFDELPTGKGVGQDQHFGAIFSGGDNAGFFDHVFFGLKGSMPARANASARSFSG